MEARAIVRPTSTRGDRGTDRERWSRRRRETDRSELAWTEAFVDVTLRVTSRAGGRTRPRSKVNPSCAETSGAKDDTALKCQFMVWSLSLYDSVSLLEPKQHR